MNKQRAAEISASPQMENVTYQGRNVYIQHVDEENDTARIYPLDEPENELSVPLSSLIVQSFSDENTDSLRLNCRI
jgi:small acid-soluble spore protein H (minor)